MDNVNGDFYSFSVPFVSTRNQVNDLEVSATHQKLSNNNGYASPEKLSNNNGYDRPLASKSIKFLPERPSSNLIRSTNDLQ